MNTMPVQCSTCHATTAVDLKLVVSNPSKAVASAVPTADFLIVTWTAAETRAMALVFGNRLYTFTGEDDTNCASATMSAAELLPIERLAPHSTRTTPMWPPRSKPSVSPTGFPSGMCPTYPVPQALMIRTIASGIVHRSAAPMPSGPSL